MGCLGAGRDGTQVERRVQRLLVNAVLARDLAQRASGLGASLTMSAALS